MLLALTCALCAAQPLQATPLAEPAPELRLAVTESAPAPAAAPVAPDLRAAAPAQHLDQTAPARAPLLPRLPGSGDGDHSHSDHMTTMWIVMGGMMAVMMVGAGVYYMNHRGTAASPVHTSGLSGPAALALPVAPAGGG